MNTILLLTGRVGMTFDRMLLYVTGGGAWVRDKFTNTRGRCRVTSDKQNRTGWTVGAGIEYGLTPNWSIAAQYNYIDLGDKDVTFGGGLAPSPTNARAGTPPRDGAAQLPLRRRRAARRTLLIVRITGIFCLRKAPGASPGLFSDRKALSISGYCTGIAVVVAGQPEGRPGLFFDFNRKFACRASP